MIRHRIACQVRGGMPHAAPILLALTGVICLPLVAVAQSRDTSIRVSSGAVVDVTVRTGRLIVRGIDGSTGAVRANGANYDLRSTGVTLTLQAGSVSRNDDARRDRDEDRDERSDAIELDVPRNVRLVISTLSADVDIRGIAGSVEVRTTSGDLQLSDVSARTIVETISGDIRTNSTSAPMRIKTVSGDIRVREARGELDVSTTSGDLSVSGEQIARLSTSSMSGDVHFDGVFTADARVRVSTHSGDVTLRLPDTAHGQVTLSTFNGTFTGGGPMTMLPVDASAERRGRNAQRYTFGTGATPGLSFDITTFTGDVRLVRGTRP